MSVKRGKIRMLLAEADAFHRQMLREYLEIRTRYEILEAGCTKDLFLICLESPPGLAVVLLDMDWPREDGLNLISEIRRCNSTIPILGMTEGRTELFSRNSRLRGLSFVEFIPKPIAPAPLHKSIKDLLMRKTEEMKTAGLEPKK